ncbi:MAG: alginate export family protein [Candidatus Hydrogenedentes bacterium]|nr:alginate export family protein [Candidatus Hydrogenedentota bacterium]
MRKTTAILVAAVLLAAAPAFAELQNIQVGGELRIKGNYITNWVSSPTGLETRIPTFFTPFRAVGDFLSGAPAFNGIGVVSPYRWDGNGNSSGFVEQRTKLNVKADFTCDVTAFIELDSYDVWGEDFRSNYITGADSRAWTGNDVEVYQAYIEMRNMFEQPLRMRVGRQELAFGSQWLVGPKDNGPWFPGRSFDALRLTYDTDMFSVDAWAAILAEGGITEEDEDVWFYGVYGTYKGIENMTFDAYWMWVRDARSLNDTNFIAPFEWVEDLFGLDDYDVTNLHTVGLRGAGQVGNLDFEIEGAYQFGEADQVGFGFKPFLYGDDGAEFDAWACTAEVGYTLDVYMQPRLWVGYAYYSGEDNRDVSFWEWINPFDEPTASVSFNRLFSNVMYNGFFDLNNDLSNCHIFQAGVDLHPFEKLDVMADVYYYLADEEFDSPAYVTLGGFRVPIAPALPFWASENDNEIGITTDLVVVYHYSEDLMFLAHWCHLFTGDGLSDGNYNARNGLVFTGGSDDEDADFFTVETRICF